MVILEYTLADPSSYTVHRLWTTVFLCSIFANSLQRLQDVSARLLSASTSLRGLYARLI